MPIYNAKELNNVNETWQQNERQNTSQSNPRQPGNNQQDNVGADLQRAIQEEAAEYDKANKEDRLLGGDRATVKDEEPT